MLQSTRFQTIAIASLLVILVAAGAMIFVNPTEAQPRFRDFKPPKNPVAASIDHGFEVPSDIRNEVRRTQRQSGGAYSQFVKVYDEHETVSVMIPVQWNDVELDHEVSGDHDSGVLITASSDLNAYLDGKAPGLRLLATSDPASAASSESLLDEQATALSSKCANNRFSRKTYSDPFFVGHYDFYSACANGLSHLTVAVHNGAGNATIVIEAAIRNEADLGAIKTVLESFELLGLPGHDDHHDHEHDDHEH